MDRVTRYPIFRHPPSACITGLALDGEAHYPIELVGVGPEDTTWSADRDALLGMVSTGAPYGRRAFPGQRFPRPLCLDHKDGEAEAGHLLPSQQQGLEQEHWAGLQGQAVRKGGTVATLWGASDHGDPRPLGHPLSTPLEENGIDRGQIDFLAARQQFMNLEQASTRVPRKPLASAAPTCAPLRASPAPKASGSPPLDKGHEPHVKAPVGERRVPGWPAGSSIRAVSDSGFRGESPEAPKETPIEREIRLAQEREADLREQRGLRRAAGHQELVEIPTRRVLTKVGLAEVPRRDRGRPSLYVQWDLVQETQREEDHRRGQQVARACAPDWVSEDPQPRLRGSTSSDCVLGPPPDARAADPAPAARTVDRLPPDAYQPYLGPQDPKPESSALRAHGKPISLPKEETKAAASPRAMGPQLPESSGKPLSTRQEPAQPLPGAPQASGGTVRWEHFHLRPLRFRVPDVPQQAEHPHAWRWEAAGAPALRLQKSHSSDLLEREVESVLRREREVAEERRNALFPEVFSPPPEEGWEPDSRSSSRASGVTGSYSVPVSPESPVFTPLHTPLHLHSGLVWRAEAPVDSAAGQRKKELWYAGINPADRVNSEILGATRVTRHKNTMAERWEAGIYATESED